MKYYWYGDTLNFEGIELHEDLDSATYDSGKVGRDARGPFDTFSECKKDAIGFYQDMKREVSGSIWYIKRLKKGDL